MYRLEVEVVPPQPSQINHTAANSVSGETGSIQHERFAHLNYDAIKQMNANQMVTGLNISSMKTAGELCIDCRYKKHQHASYLVNTAKIRCQIPGELFHSDLGGPIKPASLGGASYYVVFKDDCSGYRFVFPIKNKSDTFGHFQALDTKITREGRYKIQWLQTDNGGEFKNQQFTSYLSAHSITQEFSSPYTLQQNGFIERENQTLMEAARFRDLSKTFWAEALSTAAYALNRTPSKHLANMTPYERWTGEKPDVSHL
jgi:hypothetical protein